MTRSNIMKRIEMIESQFTTEQTDQWNLHIVIMGGGNIEYVKNEQTGQRIFDAGFIAETLQRQKTNRRAGGMQGRFSPIDVQIGADDESSAAIREAIAAGIYTPHAADDIGSTGNAPELVAEMITKATGTER